MESVGQKLRAARMQMGQTLEGISAKTRISVRNLQALENDELARFASAFFYRSFVRQFAQQVNIAYQDLAEAVQQVTSGMPEPLMPGQTELPSSGPKLPVLRSRHPKKMRWLHSLTSLMLMFMVCSGLYAIWEHSRSHLLAKPRPSGVAVHVELSVTERTWLSIMADGIQRFNGVLETHDTKVLDGREIARIRTDNAGGLNVVFNGKAIGSLGPHGQVRTVVFTKNGYAMLQASSSPAAQLFVTPSIPNGE